MGWRGRLTCLVLGVLQALGNAPFTFLAFTSLLVIPLVAHRLSYADDWKSGFAIGWWFGVGYFAWTLQWIVSPFFVDPTTIWMAPFALLLVALGMAIFWGIPSAISALIFPNRLPRLLSWAVFLGLGEYTRANIFTGFPWGLPFYLTVDTPLAQLGALVGPHGGFLIMMLILLLPAYQPKRWAIASFCVIACLAAIGYWGWQRENSTQVARSDRLLVRLIQPNAPQHLKWHPDYRDIFWQRQLDFTRAPSTQPLDVVIWPENSVYGGGRTREDLFATLSDAAGPDTAMIAGFNMGNREIYKNAMLFLAGNGQVADIYSKHHLVPFGEYLPFPKLADSLGLQGLAMLTANYSKGDGPKTIRAGGLPDFVPLICYEAIFAPYAKGVGARAQWLVQITNDAWFGGYSGPQQHLVQARFRAIEQGLPLARAANTGISAMIDPYGQLTDALALNEAGYIDTILPAPLPPTPYARFGNWPWFALNLLIMLIAVWRWRAEHQFDRAKQPSP